MYEYEYEYEYAHIWRVTNADYLLTYYLISRHFPSYMDRLMRSVTAGVSVFYSDKIYVYLILPMMSALREPTK